MIIAHIGLAQQSSASQRNTHGPKVVGADGHEAGPLSRHEIRRPAFRINVGAETAPIERQLVRESDGVDAGNDAQRLDEPSLERNAPRGIVSDGARNAGDERQHMISVETGGCAR